MAKKIKLSPFLFLNPEKCIGCGNCIRSCQKQGLNHLKLEKNRPRPIKENPCINCGMCLTHCPVKALSGPNDLERVKKLLADKRKIVVCQFAPAIRATIGEAFNLEANSDATGRLVAAFRKTGFQAVFDTCLGADITTYEESQESLEKIKQGGLPLLSSCCPAWVKFVQDHYPQLLNHLSTVRPPQIILGGLIKKLWASKQKINPQEVIVVSIMPCLAKKYEIEQKKFLIDGLKPVDYVLTTREAIQLFEEQGIDLKQVEPASLINGWLQPSGGGIIYGASGGVMNSLLRTASQLANQPDLLKTKFSPFKKTVNLKTAVINLKGKSFRLAIANGLENIDLLLKKVLSQPGKFACLEVMACPDGCIGGGGQPFPASQEVKEKRAAILRQIDKQKKIKNSPQNPFLQKIYQQFLSRKEIRYAICYTHH